MLSPFTPASTMTDLMLSPFMPLSNRSQPVHNMSHGEDGTT